MGFTRSPPRQQLCCCRGAVAVSRRFCEAQNIGVDSKMLGHNYGEVGSPLGSRKAAVLPGWRSPAGFARRKTSASTRKC